MAKPSGGGKERGGCLWKLADFAVIMAILAAVVWFTPLRKPVGQFVRAILKKIPAIKLPPIGKQKPTATPRPAPTPAPIATPTPVATPQPGATPFASPTPEATPAPEATPEAEPTPDPDEGEPRNSDFGSLSGNDKRRIEKVRDTLSNTLKVDEKQWQDNFAYDRKPDKEIRAWEEIAETYRTYTEAHPGLSDAARQEVFQVALLKSVMPEREILSSLRLKTLTQDEAKEILR